MQSSRSAKPGRWTHLAGVCDASTFTLYVDGEMVGMSDSVDIALAESSTDQLTIGCATRAGQQGNAYTDFFPGSIKNVQVFDQALTPDQIKALASQYLRP